MCGQSCGATGDPTARPLLMAATQVLLDIRYYCQILYCVSLQHVDIKHNIGQQKCCFPSLCVRRGVHSPCLSVAGTASLNSGNILWPRGWRMINGHFSHPPASLVQTGRTGSILVIIIIITSHYHYHQSLSLPDEVDCPRPEAPQQQQEEAAAPARPVVVVSAILGVSVVLTLGLLLTLALTHVRSASCQIL